jgi:hypothetical protein
MSIPTPGSWMKTPLALDAVKAIAEDKTSPVRKPFEMKPHLTDKAFKNNVNFSEWMRRTEEAKADQALAREETNEQND